MASNDVLKSKPPRSVLGRVLRGFIIYLCLIAVGVALWAWISLSWSYSDGERAGILQKFSNRGWLCKTQEGELAMFIVAGVAPQIWEFSVRDPAISSQMNAAVGRRVQLHYTEHPGIPTNCFADTRYLVDRITVVDAPAVTR